MTNEITLLKALKDGAKINPSFQPQNNKQAYLAYLCGLNIALPEPRTAEEILLCKLCVDGGKYLHTMTIMTFLGKITMTLRNNSAESLTGVYKENTDIFNGATLMIPAADIGQDEDFYATVIGYEGGGDVGLLMIDKDFPFPVIGSMPNVIDVRSSEVIDTVTTKDGGKPEQEKKVEITKNGTTEILPDDGYVLSKVTANVNVSASGENKLAQLVNRTITEVMAEDLEGVTKINDYAFYQCTALIDVIIPNSVTSIGKSAFRECNSLANVSIPNSVTNLGDNAFQDCSSLTSVTIPDSVNNIGGQAFRNCSSLTNINIPYGVMNIANSTFRNCSSLTSVTIGNGVTSIGSSAFSDSGLTSITIPNSVTTISSSVFNNCRNLVQVTLPNNITRIDQSTFNYCASLTNITIPESVTNIGTYAFNDCPKLTNLEIPSSVTNIANNALYIGSSTNKATITFLRTTPPTISSSTFFKPYLDKIIVPAGSGEAYRTATNWANLADYIEEASV